MRARAGNKSKGLDRVILGEPQSSARLRNEGELFSLQSGCAGRGAGDGHSASCAFQVSSPPPPLRGPHLLGAPPWPPAATPSAGCGAGEPRLAAAAALLQLQCHVGMLLQWESAGPGRAGPPERRVPRRLAFGAGAWPPSPFSPPWLGGSRFRHAQEGILRPTLRRPESAGSQPGGQRADT